MNDFWVSHFKTPLFIYIYIYAASEQHCSEMGVATISDMRTVLHSWKTPPSAPGGSSHLASRFITPVVSVLTLLIPLISILIRFFDWSNCPLNNTHVVPQFITIGAWEREDFIIRRSDSIWVQISRHPNPHQLILVGSASPSYIFNWFNPPTLVEFIQCFIPDLTHLNWFQLISTVFTWFHPHFTKALPFNCAPAAVAAAPDWLAPRLVRRMEVQDLRAVAVDGEDLSSGQLGLGENHRRGPKRRYPRG